ncbi:MAG: helix-turn-helix transcriptional regulator [Victivallales bacterium]
MTNLIVNLKDVSRFLPGGGPRLIAAGWMPPHQPLKILFSSGCSIAFGFILHPSSPHEYRIIVDGISRNARFPVGTVRSAGHNYKVDYAGTFEILYLCYDIADKAYFESLCGNGVLPESPWHLGSAWALERKVSGLRELLENAHRIGGADRLDAAALELVHESLLCSSLPRSTDDTDDSTLLDAIASQLGKRPLDKLLKDFGLSRRSFFRKWSRRYRETPRNYVLMRRLEHAALLLQSGTTVKQAAHESGFSTPFHLSRQFKSKYGVSPSAFNRTVLERS